MCQITSFSHNWTQHIECYETEEPTNEGVWMTLKPIWIHLQHALSMSEEGWHWFTVHCNAQSSKREALL